MFARAVCSAESSAKGFLSAMQSRAAARASFSRTSSHSSEAEPFRRAFHNASGRGLLDRLEREISELHGINFAGKKDLRNLMLQYGDTSSPFQKLFPSIGVKELFYDPLKDTLIQKNVTVQL